MSDRDCIVLSTPELRAVVKEYDSQNQTEKFRIEI